MLKIQDAVKNILYSDEEALFALYKGYMNLSAYAKQIKNNVEEVTFKDVKTTGIVVALSRLQKDIKNIHPMIQDVKINNITTKSPLSELVYEKSSRLLEKLTLLHEKIKTGNDDFFTVILSTSEITVICSDRIKKEVQDTLVEKPRMIQNKLASIGLSFDPKYYDMPNIIYSLLRKIAKEKILLAETITTHTEIIFIYHQEDSPKVLKIFESSIE
ncbi:MAG: hypothetical protein MRY49_00125 [Candidatus Pacebacteria bacterium]|nr:hypothetical protein [Candidatus Paceibacterota bacterium]